MTDLQVLTLALSVVIPLSMLVYSNSRITDVKESVNKRIDKVEESIKELQKHLDEKIDNAFAHMEMLLKLHEAEHHKK